MASQGRIFWRVAPRRLAPTTAELTFDVSQTGDTNLFPIRPLAAWVIHTGKRTGTSAQDGVRPRDLQCVDGHQRQASGDLGLLHYRLQSVPKLL